MSQFRLFRSAVAGVLLTVAPVAGVVNAQTSSPTVATVACPGGGPRALTKQEDSMVNDYEILLARANSKHTPPPDLSPDVAALIACSSGSPVAPTPAAPAAASTSAAPAAAAVCVGAPRPLTQQEQSLVNEYQILVIKAGSQNTPVPPVPPDVAALMACSSASPTTPTAAAPSASAAPKAATCPGGGPRALTKQEDSMVNDYEILLAKANSAHTPPPDLSPDVAALIACNS
jgi:hypothetical protein